ncbi:MAG: hypothetical protein AMXMBFR64_15120 [Myxococcales bacterium]
MLGRLTVRLRAGYGDAMEARETIARYAAIYRQREEERRDALARRASALCARLPEAAALLRARFGATRVGVFGSLARGRFAEGSDVDLYVDHVAPGRYFEAVASLAALLDADVDLVELDRAPASLRDLIAAEGQDVD